MDIANRLFELRKEKGLTLRELAEQVGITAAALSSYEKGQKTPSLEFAIKLSKFYGKSIDDLCGIEIKNKEMTYLDIYRFIFDLDRTLEMMRSKHGVKWQGIGKQGEGDEIKEIGFELISGEGITSFEVIIKSKDVCEFFESFEALCSISETKGVPKKVMHDWIEMQLNKAERWKLNEKSESEIKE